MDKQINRQYLLQKVKVKNNIFKYLKTKTF